MALPWFGSQKEASLADLIAKKKYAKAIEVLRAQFRDGVRDPRMRLQLADVLVLAGRRQEAVPILHSLADEFAREGFAGKAIAVLKKVEKITPGRPDVERRLAELIQRKLGTPASGSAASEHTGEIGIEDLGLSAMPVASVEAAPAQEPPRKTEDAFEEEFFDALHDMIEAGQSIEAAEGGESADAAVEPRPPVASPLFGGFSEEELCAIIGCFRLLTLEPGDIVVSEGQPGDSLFVLTTGTLKAFVRDREGRNAFVREMGEGAFFGEISVLSGKPRSATITCATRCELLELDRKALDMITTAHPGVRDVIRRASTARSNSEEEILARGSSPTALPGTGSS